MAKGDVFISAVTSEFGKARSAIAADLRARDLNVVVQDDFRQEARADTLLSKLHDYIQTCSAVVCIIGKRSGAFPKAAETKPFERMGVLPSDIKQASYTQWEFFFAQHFNRRCSVYIANDDYKPDQPSPQSSDDAASQAAYVAYLKQQGFDRNNFSNEDQLARAVLKEEWNIAGSKNGYPPPRGKPIVLPYPSIGPLFKGREGFLKQLRESLTREGGGKTAIFNAVYGLGGIGKTRAATEYAWAYQDDYSALLFVIGETPEALRRNLAALSATLAPGFETTDENARVQITLDWLKGNPDWLLILDNVDIKESLTEAERLMAQCSGGHVVITSRLANFPGEVKPLELNVLSADDACAFLMERTEARRRVADDDEEKARELAKELDGLALALEQAGAFIAARKLTFAQYLEQWRANRDKVMAWSDPTVTHYPRAVAVTWQTSVAQLTPAGRRLLERLAWLAPEPVPDFLLDVPCPDENGDLHDALADLAAYSLVTRGTEGPYFLIHRLVQDVTRRSLDEEARARSLGEALNWISDAFAGAPNDVRDWPRLEPLAPHAHAVANYSDAAGIPEPTARLMSQVATLLQTKALHAEAEPLMRRALAIAEKSFEPDHPNVAACISNLATLLQKTNRLTEAEPLTRQALSMAEKSFGPEHPMFALRLNNLATLLIETNRLDEAEPLLRRAFAIDEKSLGPNHPMVAVHLQNLAQLLHDTDRLAEAEPLMRRALAIAEKSFGLDHPTVANRLNNLAALLQKTNRPAEAEPLLHRALAIDEKSFGPDHPKVAIRLANLAVLLAATKRRPAAQPIALRCLSIFIEFRRRTGHQHPNFKAAIGNYAALLKAMGKGDAEIKATIQTLLAPPS